MKYIAILVISLLNTQASMAEEQPQCDLRDIKVWATIHNAKAQTLTMDSKKIMRSDHRNVLFYTNPYDAVNGKDKKRIIAEFEQEIIPNLIKITFKSYQAMANLNCQSSWKDENMEFVKKANNLFFSEPFILKFQNHASDAFTHAVNEGLADGADMACGGIDGMSDPCMASGKSILGGIIGTIVSLPVGAVKGIGNAIVNASGNIEVTTDLVPLENYYID